MRILVIGRGGREHAILWALKKSPKVAELYALPGNVGIASIAKCVPINELHFDLIVDFAKKEKIDLVIVAPDDPLAKGLVNILENAGIKAFGPTKEAALIESSKVFMKGLLKKYGIPTAKYETFSEFGKALAYIQNEAMPIVIKADGLAAGKGVIIAQTLEEAKSALEKLMLHEQFGESGKVVVIEEHLFGEEMSLLAFVDGECVKPMALSQDHKPVFDGNQGLNTGGMGTYSPLPQISEAALKEAMERILLPAAKAMVKEGRSFKGVLYAGLMLTKEGIKVIEFNARFGDPEAQVLLPRLKSDLLEIILSILNGTLNEETIEWSNQAAVCVILASKGYPGSFKKGLPISGLNKIKDSLIFHAGTVKTDGGVIATAGGRVLGVTALGNDIEEAREKAYRDLACIHFDGMHYRKDIAMLIRGVTKFNKEESNC